MIWMANKAATLVNEREQSVCRVVPRGGQLQTHELFDGTAG